MSVDQIELIADVHALRRDIQRPAEEAAVLSYEANLDDIVTTRRMLPLFRARRPHLYSMITQEDIESP